MKFNTVNEITELIGQALNAMVPELYGKNPRSETNVADSDLGSESRDKFLFL
jgi:hypothetical protein